MHFGLKIVISYLVNLLGGLLAILGAFSLGRCGGFLALLKKISKLGELENSRIIFYLSAESSRREAQNSRGQVERATHHTLVVHHLEK